MMTGKLEGRDYKAGEEWGEYGECRWGEEGVTMIQEGDGEEGMYVRGDQRGVVERGWVSAVAEWVIRGEG